MFSLNLPSFNPKIAEKDGKHTIFDPVRRKYVVLTPEEWVRQHFVNYLIKEKGYPKELLANEISIVLNGTNKRCDTVAYNRFLAPVLIAEYKSPAIAIKQSVIDQIIRYNMVLKVRYLIISNGINHFCCKIDFETGKYSYLEQIPTYDSIII
ncbi:MAG: type I restriction enzyme HsdR N-terminal domain-containing protein [Parabacteroides sp.]|jgi:hypothetical protein|nr:type I restriction enzyme HsdR N-terminal domain-containing protein [Parabacteroides sp.]MBP9578984.1 type I restriction enzyme HsdR N-terminal domain-containing protein [Parabacteroides sp.]MDD2415291.1 type I restriction enzyme HsdR N-terminal domain-containing protein [Parabacteroides sp.]MDD3357590.1 type I restriction enzyme HsdR N-terminal domain-containing protein [Parabacteroides sp.]MDD4403260.1 type I restriction enzyme HsdR N-terminal domain-containing protein [Parabacteroides sp.